MRKVRALIVALVTFAGLFVATASPSLAAFPGKNGLVAFQFQSGVYTVNPAKPITSVHRLTTGGAPRWSPDGKKIAFERQSNIYVMNANGTGIHKLTSNNSSHQPAWSPDGKSLVFVVVQHPHGDLFTMPATGGKMTRLTNDAATTCGNDRPTWSPNGKFVLFRQQPLGQSCFKFATGQTIRTVNVSTRHESVVVGGTDDVWGQPDISSNGQRVIDTRLNSCDCSYDLVSMNLDGSHQTVIWDAIIEHDMPFPLLNGVAAAPNGGLPTMSVYEEQTSPTRNPCELAQSQGGDMFNTFFQSNAACPQLPDWQP